MGKELIRVYNNEWDHPIEFHEKRNIWDQQIEQGETDEYYKMFLMFASLSPGQRTQANAWYSWSGKDTNPSRSYIHKYQMFKWKERADARDISILSSTQDGWVMRDNMRRDGDYTLGELFREIARRGAASIALDTEHLTPNQIARFAEVGSKLQEGAVPDLNLNKSDISGLLESLPEDKRQSVFRILVAEYRSK